MRPVLQTQHPPPEHLAVWAFLSNWSQISSLSLVNNTGVRVNREEEVGKRGGGNCGQTHRDLNSSRRERRREESRSPQQQQQRRSLSAPRSACMGESFS